MSNIIDKQIESPSKLEDRHQDFICGVVEGFYGRPWTTEQRKDLFIKLDKWGMNSYLYAPKDDCKHRVYWRELYSVEEAEHLTALIETAKENNIIFYYALSPGLDITYSSAKEVSNLKRKLDQVAQFGCHAFALLFDDILAEMCEADKEVFQSLAHAQVSLTNEIYQHLGQPKFLFCPTLYCGYRAIPDVSNSEYLQTLGSKLDLGINVMWTGPKVISKTITLESIEELTDILHRPPVIWDNLHANDYDQKRIFLGPYSGRSPNLIPHLRGVLTNPNCEYESNFIGIHTLAQWSTCVGDTNCITNGNLSADIKLETESEDGRLDFEPSTLGPKVYHPKRALRIAIKEWNKEYFKPKNTWTTLARRQFQVIAPMPILPNMNLSISSSICPPVQTAVELPINPVIAPVEMAPNIVAPFPSASIAPVMNSLVEKNKVIISSVKVEPSGIPSNESDVDNPVKDIEPMDYHPVNNPVEDVDSVSRIISNQEEDKMVIENGISNQPPSFSDVTNPLEDPIELPSETDNSIIEESSENASHFYSMNASTKVKALMEVENDTQEIIIDENKSISDGSMLVEQIDNKDILSVDDISFIVDLFYLPFEHGVQGVQILQEFNWLKLTSYVLKEAKSNKDPPEVEEWYNRAEKFKQCARHLEEIILKLCRCPNKSLLYDLYPYVWDIQGVVSLMCSYITWLAKFRGLHQANITFVTGLHTWFAKGWKEAFMSGEQEPWVFRGGLTGELQRLIPVDSPNDLFAYKVPESPISKIYSMRPYVSSDENQLYEIVRMTAGPDGTTLPPCFSVYPDLIPDKLIGGFLLLCPELCFVVEDGTNVLGFCVACSDVKQYYRQLKVSWLPELQSKYPKVEQSGNLSAVDLEILALHDSIPDIPTSVVNHHGAEIYISILPSVLDPSVPKRLVTCLLSALRSNGTFGAFVQLQACDKFYIDFYGKLAFMEINLGEEKALSDKIFLGRTF